MTIIDVVAMNGDQDGKIMIIRLQFRELRSTSFMVGRGIFTLLSMKICSIVVLALDLIFNDYNV